MAQNAGKSSTAMAVARIAVGLIFIMFAQYKLFRPEFAHGGYEKYVTGYAVAVAEMLIGLSMVLGFWVRPFAILGGLFMLNLLVSTWILPAGTPAWRYLGNQLDNISLFFLFLLFFVHQAGETLGLDRSRSGRAKAAAGL